MTSSLRVAGLAAAAALLLTAAADGPEFSYDYPAKARAIPALKARLDRESAALRAKLTREDAAFRRQSEQQGFPYRAYVAKRSWKVVADTPRFLSLSMEGYDYEGGAHGMPSYAALVWDKARGGGVTPIAMFDRAALSRAIRPAFCADIRRQRELRRGEPAKPGSKDMFDACIDPVENTILVGSAAGGRFDRIGVIVGPFAAGPYAEGSYEVTLPVTPAVLAAVRPAYRAAFAVR